MPILKDIIRVLEAFAPPALQESYDNAGLQVGDADMPIEAALLSLDMTIGVLDEAERRGCNLVLTHHPLIFGGLKSLTGRNETERIVISAIRRNIAIYSAHTNLDAVPGGVNGMLASRLGLQSPRILDPMKGRLKKLVVFVPHDHLEPVRQAIFDAGAGHIGAYDQCSYRSEGQGSFRPLDGSRPYVGKEGSLHLEAESRLETILPEHLVGRVVEAMCLAHPYEEVAYDLYPLDNPWNEAGMGMIGELEEALSERAFMDRLKAVTGVPVVRHSALLGRKISKVALCGGAGSFLIRSALREAADVFLTGDLKYHQFFEAEGRLVLMDIGHFESEQFTRDLFYDLLTKNFPKFAVRIAEIDTNPIKYY